MLSFLTTVMSGWRTKSLTVWMRASGWTRDAEWECWGNETQGELMVEGDLRMILSFKAVICGNMRHWVDLILAAGGKDYRPGDESGPRDKFVICLKLKL